MEHGSLADHIHAEDKKPRCRLYLITPASLTCDAKALATYGVTMAAALDAGDVSCIQLRLKGASDDDWRRATLALMPIAQERDIAFILNDRADLAADLGCDGVHIGQDDMPYAEARARLGRDAIIGVTCKASRDLALDAAEAGADYVAFGAFYESNTKQVTTPASLEILEWWAHATSIPSVAIGGITADNAAPVIRAGADFLAIAGGVWAHPEGAAAGVKAINAAIDAA